LRILITGGSGFIGSHLADAYIERGDEVFIVDDLSTGSIAFTTRSTRCRTSRCSRR
jgi:UDP-glucose 4-epimerase